MMAAEITNPGTTNPGTPPAQSVSTTRWLRGRPGIRSYTLRGWILVFSLVVAFHDTFSRVLEMGFIGFEHDILLVLLMAAVLFMGLDRTRARALDIHDREVDYIVGCMALIIAITVKTQLLPRFVEWDALLRLDILAILVFVFGASGLLYGMRSTLHFGPGWALLFLYNPPVHLIVSTLLGGGWWGTAMANTLGLALAVSVALNRDLVQKIYFGVFALVVGMILATVMWLLNPPPFYLTHVPGIVAAVVVVYNTSRGNPGQWSFLRWRIPTVKDTRWATILILIAVVVLAVNPVPRSPWSPDLLPEGPVAPSTPGVSVSPDWEVTGYREYEWASRYFGPGSSLVRQELTSREYNPDWDQSGLARTVVVDTLLATDYYQARAFGDETLYSTLTGRKSESRTVDLGYGISGRVYTVLDESDFLTYTKLVFSWTREDSVVENISVIAVDDHRPEARFPQLAPSLGLMFTQVFTILLRGNAVTVDTQTEYKDMDLVTTVARDIVGWQMERDRGERDQ
ncbi:hypothetical protein [Corynebacterium efficiens YS-314]|uniref:Uncharacterized protein n=2 Tax=Corynebacterium efficiens TaxID=152794 RepID=Q8FU93_COREF|nr:hypothetical protein [Corynebacterium efficiens YS-314]